MLPKLTDRSWIFYIVRTIKIFEIKCCIRKKITNWRRATGVGHKDRRGVFVTEENKSQVLADLGILGSDENDNDRARKGEDVKIEKILYKK